MEHLNGFAPLAERYEGFVLDLWGVIHDGVHAFPEAVDTLERLRAMGRRTLLLSNAPRPNATVQGMMRRMGIPDSLYTAILTSGEAVRRSLRDPPDAWWAIWGGGFCCWGRNETVQCWKGWITRWWRRPRMRISC